MTIFLPGPYDYHIKTLCKTQTVYTSASIQFYTFCNSPQEGREIENDQPRPSLADLPTHD